MAGEALESLTKTIYGELSFGWLPLPCLYPPPLGHMTLILVICRTVHIHC